jgi:hypothetical protein
MANPRVMFIGRYKQGPANKEITFESETVETATKELDDFIAALQKSNFAKCIRLGHPRLFAADLKTETDKILRSLSGGK